MINLSSKTQAIIQESKNTLRKIVFTNGCFDILHRGHVSYLNNARNLGDYLIIGLNSDDSIKKIKGPNRPIQNEQDRKYILENLKCVDCVEIFNEETPLNLIKHISPNILVKGGDWPVENIIGSEHVLSLNGEVKSLNLEEGLSTSNIVEKIKSS
jgi:D-glycero-beta-D-manno-heptose 1-phosphate adenylyltransferase